MSLFSRYAATSGPTFEFTSRITDSTPAKAPRAHRTERTSRMTPRRWREFMTWTTSIEAGDSGVERSCCAVVQPCHYVVHAGVTSRVLLSRRASRQGSYGRSSYARSPYERPGRRPGRGKLRRSGSRRQRCRAEPAAVADEFEPAPVALLPADGGDELVEHGDVEEPGGELDDPPGPPPARR